MRKHLHEKLLFIIASLKLKKVNAKQVQVTYNQWIFVFQKVLLFMTPTSNDNFQSAITNCFSIFALIENQLEKWVFINN